MSGKEETVGEWLTAHGAGAYVQQFTAQGWEDKDVLTEQVIQTIIHDKPGLAAGLWNALVKERKAAAPRDPRTPLPAPSLPPGTQLDLSAPQITAAGLPPFQLPAELTADAGTTPASDIVSPYELTTDQWLVIARNSGLLRAYTMEDFDPAQMQAGKEDAPKGVKPVLDWYIPEEIGWLVSEIGKSTTLTSVELTESTSSYVQVGFDSEAASGGYAGSSASFEREHRERTARSNLDKTLYMFGSWYVPRATLDLTQCARVSPKFVEAVRSAIAAADPAVEMDKVFKDYGVAIPSRVVLGGQYYFVHQETMHGETYERQVEDTIKVAVSIKTAGGEGTTSGTLQSGSDTRSAAQKLASQVSITIIGGDTTKLNPGAWLDTLKKEARLWAVVRKSGLRSVLDLLPEDLRRQAYAVWDRMPPLFGPPVPLAAVGQAKTLATPAFLVAHCHARGDSRGWFRLSAAKGTSPRPDQPDMVAAGGSVHWWWDGRILIDHASTCLPIPAGYGYRTEFAGAEALDAQLSLIPTKLQFGDWQPLRVAEGVTASGDGLIVGNVSAPPDGSRLIVRCLLDGVDMAGAAVHHDPNNEHRFPLQSFCIPVPSGSQVTFKMEESYGQPEFKAWWLPLVSRGIRLGRAEPLFLDTDYGETATDGLVHFTVAAPSRQTRGAVVLESGRTTPSPVVASAAVSQHPLSLVRWEQMSRASAMLPVPKGQAFRLAQTTPDVQTHAWWTAILPG